VIPSLASRVGEISQIVEEYARDARTSLGTEKLLSTADRAWILEHSASTLPDIEKGTLRVVALRKAGSKTAAAELLGMSHPSLSRWLDSRPPLTGLGR
jgi:hypothetical protein